MSVEALAWLAQNAPGVKPHWMGTLFALCNSADEKGVTSPGQAWQAWVARKDERNVREDLRGMEAAGLIRKGDQRRVAHLPPDKRPVVWQLALETDRGPRPEPGKPGRPATRNRGGVHIPPDASIPPVSPETGGRTHPPGCEHPPVFDLGKQAPDGKRGDASARQNYLGGTQELPLKEGEQPAPSGAQDLTADEEALIAEVTAAAPRWSPAAVRGVLVDGRIRERPDRAVVRLAFLLAAEDRPAAGRGGTRTPRRLLHDSCPFWAQAELQLHPPAPAAGGPVLLGVVEWCRDDGCDRVTRVRVNADGVPLPGRPRCPDCHPQSPAVHPGTPAPGNTPGPVS